MKRSNKRDPLLAFLILFGSVSFLFLIWGACRVTPPSVQPEFVLKETTSRPENAALLQQSANQRPPVHFQKCGKGFFDGQLSRCVCDFGFYGWNCSNARLVTIWNDEEKARSQTFIDIYSTNFWKSSESRSGRGSSLHQTETVRKEIERIIDEYHIGTMLDAACGDMNWMKHVALEGVQYVGADIVPGLIEANRARFANSSHLQFLVSDFVRQVPHKAFDLILSRDAMVHLPNKDVARMLRNFNLSGSRFLLATLFKDHSPKDISKPGEWRQINLLQQPFNFPKPLEMINEGYWGVVDTSRPYFNDKCLGLWKLPVPVPDIVD